MSEAPLFCVNDVVVAFDGPRGTRFHAVDGVSFDLHAGEAVGLVGESGCGKSTLGRALLRLVELHSGQVLFRGDDVYQLKPPQLRALRRQFQMVFQDAGAALNPRHTIARALAEPLEIHALHLDRKQERVLELLSQVGLTPDVLPRFSHALSGGQKQRVGIARALAVEPRFVVLDEPVSALDASVRAQVVNLLSTLTDALSLATLWVSHDLAVVRHVCKRVMVMYLGKIVESGDVDAVLSKPMHPYTHALKSSVPHADPARRGEQIPLIGEPGSALEPPTGCRFHPRCERKTTLCSTTEPQLIAIGDDPTHIVACHHPL